LFAASMALVENDIKRILAFSTLSQLGYMVMALGLGGYTAGIYHLTTHAFFKALLFLGAGSAIHAVHSNDIWKMGGLLKKMPITGYTFLLATLALCGIFPLSGFWSKDEILAVAFHQNKILYLVGTLTAGLTSFYMGRLFSIAFLGETRDHHTHPHESPWAMTIPLMLLTIPTIFGGFMGFPEFLNHTTEGGIHVKFNMTVAIISSIVAIAGLTLAYFIFAKGMQPSAQAQKQLTALAKPLAHKYWIDEIYSVLNQGVQQQTAIFLGLFEKYVIMGLFANGMAKVTGVIGSTARKIQTGRVQTYAFMIWVGFAAIFVWVFRWVP
jgi:NADH-quinone oxidoreductase subunit L